MKLINEKYELTLELNENETNVLVVENPSVLAELLQGLREAIMTGESDWILSSDKILPMEKCAVLIMDPWSADINGKLIKTRLFRYLTEIAQEEHYDEFLQLRGKMAQYIERIAESSPYALSYREDFENSDILKWMEVCIDTKAESFEEHLTEYLKLLGSLCGIRVVFFWGLHDIVGKDELQSLYQESFYRKICLVLLESHQTEKMDQEKFTVIDRDCCVITF